MKIKNTLLYGISFAMCRVVNARTYVLTSPDGKIGVEVMTGDTLQFTLQYAGKACSSPSAIYLQLDKGRSIGLGSAAKSRVTGPIREEIEAPLYRQAKFDVTYNQLTLSMKNGGVVFRAYDEGVAYRFYSDLKEKEVEVLHEGAVYCFPENATAYMAYSTNAKNPMAMAFQNTYTESSLADAPSQLAFLPVTIALPEGPKVTLLESDLESYPGMFVTSDSAASNLRGVFAQYPKSTDYYPWRKQLYVTEKEDCIARVNGKRDYPWRVFAITDEDKEMPTNNLVYALASPSRIEDSSWITGGKVAWDWWNEWGLKGVDFEAGINTATYKHYIDFAAKHGLEYIILDEGWYVPKSGDMLTVVPEVDLEELVRYGKEKGVDLVLWTVFNVLDDQLEEACKRYADMGIKGFKVDFLDRDDQTAVEMTYRLAEACARHNLILDYHGIYKPTGLNRTYPNVVNYEAVFGMEEVKWMSTTTDMPRYNVTFPFIRMMAGYVDFTPGAMLNATKKDYRAIYNNPMSMGTRSHQAAMYVVQDSPFTMLADSPSMYDTDSIYTAFIAQIPTVVDETVVLDGKLGEYIVTARKKGDVWYVGGMTNWDGRELNIPLSFLGNGNYVLAGCVDGVNAHRNATDYRMINSTVNAGSSLPVTMAPGGGFAFVVTPQ